MTILARVQQFVKEYSRDILLAVFVILATMLSFAVGYLTAREEYKEPITSEKIYE